MSGEHVLVVGSANMDLVVRSDRFPLPGETIFGTSFATFPGGKGANQAVCCAKLGAKVEFLGKMGNDMFHERLSASMKHDGVSLEHILVDATEPTGTALITVDGTGQNEIIVISGSNMRLRPEEVEGKRNAFGEASVVLVQLEIPLDTVVQAARLGREHSVIIVLNPAPARVLPDELFRMVDYITPNETEAQILTGVAVRDQASAERAARVLLERGVKNVIVTMGSAGCLHVNAQHRQHYPARRVEAVDTTAAGDAFNGALAFALARKHDGIDEAITFANTVAAFSVTRHGAQSAMPTMPELDDFTRHLGYVGSPASPSGKGKSPSRREFPSVH